jgi:hypothetical protein
MALSGGTGRPTIKCAAIWRVGMRVTFAVAARVAVAVRVIVGKGVDVTVAVAVGVLVRVAVGVRVCVGVGVGPSAICRIAGAANRAKTIVPRTPPTIPPRIIARKN